MSQQDDHVIYTRNEWTNISIFVDIINYLKNKNIKFFVDLGANVGEVSKIFLEQIPNIVKITAYEPEKVNYNYLKNRFCNDSRVQPINKAIFYGLDNTLYANGGCGSHTLTKTTNYVVQNVETSTLEDEGLTDIDLIKIDVEGSEYNIIKNSLILQTIRFIIIEFHPFSFPDSSFDSLLPSTENRQARVDYIKNFTDNFVHNNFPNHKIVLNKEEQYLLELVD